LHLKSVVSEKAKFVLWGRSMGAVTGNNIFNKSFKFFINKQISSVYGYF